MSSINDKKMIQKRSLDSSSGACMPPCPPAPPGPAGLVVAGALASALLLAAAGAATWVSLDEWTEADDRAALPVGDCLSVAVMSDTSVACECCRVLARSAGGLSDIEAAMLLEVEDRTCRLAKSMHE